MSPTLPRPASALRLTAIFAAYLLGMIALFLVLLYIAETYFNLPFENSAMGVIVIMVAGMSTGQTWFKREQQMPSSGRKWLIALLATLVVLVAQAGLLALVSWADPALKAEISREGPQFLAIIAAVAVIFDVLVVRLGLWMGLRSAAKLAEKQAAAV